MILLISNLAKAQTFNPPTNGEQSLPMSLEEVAYTNIDPALAEEMERRSDDEKIRVVVIMKSQYDRQQLSRSAAHYTSRADRREYVVNELKRFAEATQDDLRHTLFEMERQDMTTAPKILWMANAMYFSANKQAIRDLANRRDIEIIGFDEKKHVSFDETPRPAGATRDIASNVTQVNANMVWDLGYTGQGVVVAVIDSGVNYNHVDLADHLWDGGYEYPYHGYDFINYDYDPMDDMGHGTHCAGTVCGDGTAGEQTGMAPDATLMCVKVMDYDGGSYASVACEGMQWAVDQGCDVISMSMGWTYPTYSESMLFRNTCVAILEAGVIGAIAAGNNGEWIDYYPAPDNVCAPGSCPPPYMDPVQDNNSGGLSCVVCVGAVDEYDNAAPFTSHGPVTWYYSDYGDYPYMEGGTTDFGLIRPDVCAPGVDIISANYYDNYGYTYMDGTSMATPCVAGCMALLLSQNMDATPAEICQVLEETAVPLAEGKSNIYGYGRIDVLAAINAQNPGPLTLDSAVINDEQGNNNGNLNAGEAVSIDLTLTNNSDVDLDGVTMWLSTESEYVTITDGTAALPYFNAGQTQTLEGLFSFTLSNSAPINSTIQFIAEIFDDGESLGHINFNFKVYGHIFRFDEVTVLNDNNGNGSLEAGETANLHLVISNIGNEIATSVVGTLSTTSPYVTINSNDKYFGGIEVDGQSSANFNVSLSSSIPDTYTIEFILDLVDDDGIYTDLEFELWRRPITLTSNLEGAGVLSGGGNYGLGQTCVISATANDGYVFNKWTKNGTTVSYLPTYSFTVTEEATYVANFQQVDGIVIGDANSINTCLPTNVNKVFSLTQQIYTAAEMGGQPCQISSLSFFNTVSLRSRKLDVYLVHTDKTSFESATDWITVTEEDKVYSGTASMTAYGWATIYFSTPFDYDGSSNLALVVDDNSSGYYYGSSLDCRTFNTSDSQAIYVCGNSNYDPYNPTAYTGTLLTEKNQVLFGYARYIYSVSVTANPSEGGTVSGGEGMHYYGEPVTLTATPNDGYVFIKWTKNGSIVSNLSTYRIQVTGDAQYVAHFQQVDGIAIGEATYTNSYLPYMGYEYSMSQQIYTADELNTEACEFSSVSFFNTGYSETRNLAVFMVNTDKTSFESSSDWITLTEADLVFSGSVTTKYRDWTTIYFSYPFSYDGSSNVALVVCNETGDYGSGFSCRTFDTESSQAMYCYNYEAINPYNLSGCYGTRLTVKNEIILEMPSYEYTLTLTADPEEGGTVSGGGGMYFYGQPAVVQATPNVGYAFNYWTKYNDSYGYDEVLSYYPIAAIPVTESSEYVAHFQRMDGVTIGEATQSSSYLPTCSDYRYSMTQQIYTADELNMGACDIYNISFFNTGYYTYRYLTIYLVNTDKTAFEHSSDWIAVDYENQVFSGEVAFEEGAWTTINFYSPFYYDGSSNLALVVCDESGDGGWGMSCRTFNSELTQTLYAYEDNGGYWYDESLDPYYPYEYYGTLLSEKNEVIFGNMNMVIVSADPEEGGTVSGGGEPFEYGQSVTISATANPGYVFNYWSRYDDNYGYYETISCLSTVEVTATGVAEYVAHFQQKDGIVIGDAADLSSCLPTYTYAKYSMTQQIFTASEIGTEANEISSVSFFTTYSSTRNLDIYMVSTDKTSFESNTDWVTVTENDKVFSGNVSMNGYGWTTIYFATPFNYDGVSNVVLVVDDNTNSNSYGGSGRTFSTEDNQTIRVYGSDTNYDPSDPSGYTGTLMTMKNQVVFGIASYEFMASVSANPSYGGTVSGGGGPYYYGQPIPISAVPNPGYVFNKWTKNGSTVSYLSTDNVSVTETAEYVANFQEMEGLIIGEAASSSLNLPTNYYYSLTQQIFTADEMGGVEREISSVSFFNTISGRTRNLDVYMVNTDKTSFESNTDWIPVTENDKVFGGSATITGYGWTTIYFATPFSYDGVSNVALIVDDNSNNYNSMRCRTFGTEDNQAICISGYGTNYDPYNPSSYSGTLMSEKNQVVFGFPNYQYMITATSESSECGTVSGGGGLYYYGQPVTLTAIPNEGYAFKCWTKNGTVASYLSPYTIVANESAEYVAHFQQVNGFVIGDAAGTSIYLPGLSYYYNLSEQIYTADELDLGPGEISSVAFFNTGTTRSRNYTIYLVNTNKTDFNSSNDWIRVSSTDRVFTGVVDMESGSWTTISFDTPFDYDGVSNIALIVDDNTGSYNYPYMSCRVYPAEGYQSLYSNSYEENINPYYYSDYGTRMTVKNQVVFGFTSAAVQQTIGLSAGVNWVSFNVDITLDDLKAALVATGGTNIVVKAKSSSTTWNGHRWLGSLNGFNVNQMYMVTVQAGCEITLEGMPITPVAHPVTISNGTNWIGYPLDESMTLTEAFSGFPANQDVVKSKNASATWNGHRWVGQLSNLVPGQGYIYQSKASGNKTLIFPMNDK